jgi:phage terminase large subunit-like protein
MFRSRVDGHRDNLSNLPARFLKDIASFGRSALARQELDGELLTDIEGAVDARHARTVARTCPFCRADANGDRFDPRPLQWGRMRDRVAQLGDDVAPRILADATVMRASPEKWARAVAEAAAKWRADRVVAEANQGGAMVESVLRAANVALPIRLVPCASVGRRRGPSLSARSMKRAGAPCRAFPALEDQLCGLVAGRFLSGAGPVARPRRCRRLGADRTDSPAPRVLDL